MHFRTRLHRVFAVSCCAASICPAQSGAQQTSAEVTQRDAPVTFSSGVNLVLVPVVVRDAKGHAIGNLTKDDFQIFDKGKLQTIAKFSVEKAEAPPIIPDTSIETDPNGNLQTKPAAATQPVAGHFIMWLFDDVHLKFGDLAQTREAAKKVLRDSFEPGTRAAIYTTSNHTSVDFTDDRDKIETAMNEIKPWPTIPTDDAVKPCPDVSYFQADRAINANDQQALLAAQVDFLSCPENAGTMSAAATAGASGASAQAVSSFVQSQTSGLLRMELLKEVEIGFQDTRTTLLVLKNLIRRMSAMPGSRTIVMVSPGFYLVNDHRTDETDVINAAIRSNVVISSLDARGLYTVIPGGTADTPAGNVDPATLGIKQTYATQTALANQDVLEELAAATGGSFYENSNDYYSGLKQLATQPEYIYILGFAPQNLKLDGSYHKLKVVLRNGAGLEMQARRGYFERNHLESAAEQAKEEIKEAFFSRDEIRELPVELHTQYFKTGDFNAKLSILARVDVKHLRFRKADGRNNDTLTVVGGVFDRNGNYVTGVQKTVDMKLKDQTLDALPESGITVKSNVDVASGNYIVRLVVRDSEGQIMSALNSAVAIP